MIKINLQPVRNASVLCTLAGLGGGAVFGYLLSRGNSLLTPLPWALYLVLLFAVVGLISLGAPTLTRPRRRPLELYSELPDWPLPTLDNEDIAPAIRPGLPSSPAGGEQVVAGSASVTDGELALTAQAASVGDRAAPTSLSAAPASATGDGDTLVVAAKDGTVDSPAIAPAPLPEAPTVDELLHVVTPS